MLTVFQYVDRKHLPRKIILSGTLDIQKALTIPVVGPRLMVVMLKANSGGSDKHYRFDFRRRTRARVVRTEKFTGKQALHTLEQVARSWPCDYIFVDPTGERNAAALGALVAEFFFKTDAGFFEKPLRPDIETYAIFRHHKWMLGRSRKYVLFNRTNVAAHLADLPEINDEQAKLMPHWQTVQQMATKLRTKRNTIWYDLMKKEGKLVGVRFNGIALVMLVEDYARLMTDLEYSI